MKKSLGLVMFLACFLVASAGFAASVNVTNAAALNGSNWGLEVDSTGGGDAWVEDQSPSDETHFIARFWFDPNTFMLSEVPGDGESVRIFQGQEQSPSTAILRVYVIQRDNAGNPQYRVRVFARRDGNTGWAKSQGVVLGNAPRQIEVEWQAASAIGANDGFIRITRVDNGSFKEVTGIDSDERRIGRARLGIFTGGFGTGTLYLDEYESFR